jgi:hypothetical protein
VCKIHSRGPRFVVGLVSRTSYMYLICSQRNFLSQKKKDWFSKKKTCSFMGPRCRDRGKEDELKSLGPVLLPEEPIQLIMVVKRYPKGLLQALGTVPPFEGHALPLGTRSGNNTHTNTVLLLDLFPLSDGATEVIRQRTSITTY